MRFTIDPALLADTTFRESLTALLPRVEEAGLDVQIRWTPDIESWPPLTFDYALDLTDPKRAALGPQVKGELEGHLRQVQLPSDRQPSKLLVGLNSAGQIISAEPPWIIKKRSSAEGFVYRGRPPRRAYALN